MRETTAVPISGLAASVWSIPTARVPPMSRTRSFAWCRLCGPRGANGCVLGRVVHARMIEMEWDPATGYVPAPFYRDHYVGPVEFP